MLEAAWFEPMAIARTSKRLGLRSEASARFEKGVDAGGVERAVARFCALAVELRRRHAWALATVWRSDEFAPQPATLSLRTARVNALLGTDLDDDAIDGYLTRYRLRRRRVPPPATRNGHGSVVAPRRHHRRGA